MTYEIPVIKTQNPKPRPADESKLGFAKYFTDHMFVMEYDEGKGWHSWRVEPPCTVLDRACICSAALRANDV